MVRVLELFAGIGACSKALTNLGIEHEIIDAVEIDKYAIKSFNAIHGTNFEPQDITKWDKCVGRIDLLMHGSPCQDFSFAGKQAGGDKGSGTRSSLMYESLRIIEKVRPHIVIWENVKAVLSKKHRHNFDNYLEAMESLGYINTYQVLNAKDYGVPQNRERVFTVSVNWHSVYLDEPYKFPAPIPLEKRLKDLLDPVVNDSYYLSDEQVKKMKMSTYSQNRTRIQEGDVSQTLCARDWKDPKCVKVGDLGIKGQDCIKRVYSPKGISPTLTTMGGSQREPKIIDPFIVASRGRNPENPSDRSVGMPTEQRLEPKYDGTTNTLTSVQKDNYVVEPPYRIRKLTEGECWKLMGFSDEDVAKIKAVGMSKTQMYKQAGNSIVVPVLEAILKPLFLRSHGWDAFSK